MSKVTVVVNVCVCGCMKPEDKSISKVKFKAISQVKIEVRVKVISKVKVKVWVKVMYKVTVVVNVCVCGCMKPEDKSIFQGQVQGHFQGQSLGQGRG